MNKLNGHSARVGALAWNGDILSSGSRDRLIMQRDTRTPPQTCEKRLEGHRQEVCGLKWSPDNQYLASGGNDNRETILIHTLPVYVLLNVSHMFVVVFGYHVA